MGQHTQGPWFVDDGADAAHMARCLIDNPTWVAIEDTADDGGHLAYCALDNAALIAAAPDLLAALDALLEGSASALPFLDRDTVEHLVPLLNSAEAAIAKVKGE